VVAGLLADARQAHAGVLVVRGEAGMGKSALLQDAAERARDFHILRGAGVESEVQLAFAALQQLLRPDLDRLERLPGPQAEALRGAFGLVDTKVNPFLVELGVLGLFTELAQEQPVLCLVDDAQRLDRASADALVFVARRLECESIVLLLAARDDDVRQFDGPGLPFVRLEGLDPVGAAQLLEAQAGQLAPEVRDRLIQETGGNPLALEELPATLSSQQLAGLQPLPERLPLSARLQQAFLERTRRLPAPTQSLLLVAAAEDTGELATILAAGHALDYGQEALEPAELAGLVRVTGSELRFRHSLVRSAIYQSATFMTRQAAHRSLTEALAADVHADRRAWHLAAATLEPDEEVARALEVSAERGWRRGGPTAAAAALERAAELTSEPGRWARRLVAAAGYLWEAGHAERAQALLDRIERLPDDPALRARIAHLRGEIELACGTPATACTLLVEGAGLILASDPSRATEMLVLATWAALAAGDLDRIVQEIGPAVPHLRGRRDLRVQRVADSLVAFGIGHSTGFTAAREMSASPWPPPAFTWVWPMLVLVEPDADDLTADQRYARSVAARRAAGTVSSLTVVLANLAITESSLGRWAGAISNATEGLRLARETGQQPTTGYFLALLAAIAAHQGRTDDCRRFTDEALAVAAPRRLVVVSAFASWTLAQLDLAQGRPAAALERLRALATPQHPTAHATIALLATADLVEAAARTDALEGMEEVVARFERWAEWDKRTWTSVVARRGRALISQGVDAERHFQAALAVAGIGERRFELARTELAYGEWLRRARRRAEARPHLRAALELFERLGATPWAERTRSELRASGQRARKRDSSTREQLTVQEQQVARLAAQGLTNRQIADQLFLSTHTVGYHLHKVYTKLGIASRAGLSQLDLDDDPGRADPGPHS
jgi:DNA-binding CsgD family transcriptional regulator